MLAFIRALPILIVLGGAGYGAHKWIVDGLESQINVQQSQIDQLTQQTTTLQTAAKVNEQTIRGLEETAKQQTIRMTELTTNSAQWEQQARESQRIFADHNFTKLARLRPEMIEKRANAATADVFRSVEKDSRDIQSLQTQDTENESDNNSGSQ